MEKIFNLIQKSGTIDKIVYKLISYIKPEDVQDIIQDLYLEVFSIPQEKLLDLHSQGRTQLLNYVASVCIYNITNKQSKILKKYGYDLADKNIQVVSFEDLVRKEVGDGSEE